PVLDMAKKDPQRPDGFIIASAMTSSSAAKVAFRLYDTYGIPLELTKDWWDTKHKIIFDENLYFSTIDKSMDEQKIRSKSQSAMKGDVFSVKDIDHGLKETRFLGYKVYSNKAKIVKILKDWAEVKKISPGEEAAIILDATCFYGESGGQVGDSGEIVKGKNIFEVTDTKRSNKIILHIGKVKEGSFKKNDPVTAKINLKRRLAIARNHTATHLLQAALRKVLGMHVQQQGSLVAENKLRFDFTHFKDVSKEELDRIEEVVNSWVIENFPVGVVQKSLVEAKKSGALAFFGEKYDAKVRIVSTGDLSKEFCGGTHLNFTGQIGLFKILSEGSVASGVRRIEAATGNYAYKAVKEEEDALAEISARLGGAAVDKLAQELDKRNSLIKELEKEINARKVDSLKESVDSLINAAELINGKKFIARIFESVDMDLLRKNADLIKQKTDNAIMSFGSRSKDRAMLVIGVTLDLCGKGVDAGKLIKEVGPIIGGSGGGRADFAQAGGTKPDNLEAAILKLKEII
ncbi:MAG: alanine--tRNA ligase, partial [Candidatus Omnitrophica bacterium]|nr:alanine--tRNA ligase [Candidatus Omnitrophota bacterium]